VAEEGVGWASCAPATTAQIKISDGFTLASFSHLRRRRCRHR
jgi:hypothetical protein